MSLHKRGKKGTYYFNFTINGKKYFRSTIKITERYAHLDPSKLVRAVEALEG